MTHTNTPKADHRESTFLFGTGGLLLFLGFIFPGWAWLLLSHGQAGNLSLSLSFIVGLLGVIIILAASLKRFREKRTQ